MSRYHDNKGVRDEIDRILKRNAKRQANLGTESTEQEREQAKQDWASDLIEIAKFDKDFAKVLEPQSE